jgi:hypothetical protein
MVSSPWSRRCGLVIVAIVTVAVISVAVSVGVAFVVAVVIDRCRRCRLHCCRLLSPPEFPKEGREEGNIIGGQEGTA